MASYQDICLWKKDRLQQYLQDRGLPISGSRDELRALAYGVQYFSTLVKPPAKEENRQWAEQHRHLLTVNGTLLPDTLSDLLSFWVGEKEGISQWPPCMYGDLAEYLVDRSERELRSWLMTDYKQGKAFSYFDSRLLKEVFFHKISEHSPYCFLKAECTPSMNVSQQPHTVWVCIMKKTGKIVSGYCSCFAG